MFVNALSDHARLRMQQRGIPGKVLECLLEYGHVEYDHHGGMIVYFNKVARSRLNRGSGRNSRLDKHLNTYAVIAQDGTVKTVGHRYKRIFRA